MRVCVLTSGHLSTSPRMLKAADALAGAGHAVRVVSTNHVDWATAADGDVRQARRWDWNVVDYSAASADGVRIRSGARQRLARAAAAVAGPARVPLPVAIRAFARVHDEIVRAALSAPADFFYGGTTGALAATVAAARSAGVPCGIDLEDFHRGERQDDDAELMNAVAARVEEAVIPQAHCLTAAGPAMADEYARLCGRRVIAINNTFALPPVEPDFAPSRDGRLSLYWFSQTIGAWRGLEEVIHAGGLSKVPLRLTLRGRPVAGFIDALCALGRDVAPNIELFVEPPASPDAMVEVCRGFDVGLAVEQPLVRNKDLALSNKALTYPLAGLAVVLTGTRGQLPLAADLGEGAFVYEPGRPDQLAEGLSRWYRDPPSLARARRAAWAAARRRWHWDHPCERHALVSAIEQAARSTRDTVPTTKDRVCASS